MRRLLERRPLRVPRRAKVTMLEKYVFEKSLPAIVSAAILLTYTGASSQKVVAVCRGDDVGCQMLSFVNTILDF